jgi:hypothetical protein
MDRLFRFAKSDLFWSLAGGFALGMAGIAVIKPAVAGDRNDSAKSVTVETPDYARKFASTAR